MWERAAEARLAEPNQVRGWPDSENAVADRRASRTGAMGEEGVVSRSEHESSAPYDDSELHGVSGGGVSAGSESRRFRDDVRGVTSFAVLAGGEARGCADWHRGSTPAASEEGWAIWALTGFSELALRALTTSSGRFRHRARCFVQWKGSHELFKESLIFAPHRRHCTSWGLYM